MAETLGASSRVTSLSICPPVADHLSLFSFPIWIHFSWPKKLNMRIYWGEGRINLPLGPTYIPFLPSDELIPIGFGHWNRLDDGYIYRKSSHAFFKVSKPTFIVNFPFPSQTRLEETSTDWVRFGPVSGCNKTKKTRKALFCETLGTWDIDCCGWVIYCCYYDICYL